MAPCGSFACRDQIETSRASSVRCSLMVWYIGRASSGFGFGMPSFAARRRTSPRFRPMWSPEMLLGANYIGRAFAASRAVVSRVPEAAGPCAATSPCPAPSR